MARKKKVEESKRMSPEQYWEWRCTMEELKTAKFEEKNVRLQQEIMNKDLENKKLKLILFREAVSKARKGVESAEAEYEKFKQGLEETFEIDFSDVVIDELTYEIKKL